MNGVLPGGSGRLYIPLEGHPVAEPPTNVEVRDRLWVLRPRPYDWERNGDFDGD